MTYPIARGVRIEMQSTVAAAKIVSAITNANPGEATSTAHGLSDGAYGYMTGLSGMVNLEDQAIRIANGATNTFELENIDTTDFAAFSGTASFYPVTAWMTLGFATSHKIGGGAGNDQNQTTLLDDIEQLVSGLLSAQTVSIDGFSAMRGTAMQAIQAAALTQTAKMFRVTLPSANDGTVRIYRGVPVLPTEDMTVGQNITTSFSINVRGRVVYLDGL